MEKSAVAGTGIATEPLSQKPAVKVEQERSQAPDRSAEQRIAPNKPISKIEAALPEMAVVAPLPPAKEVAPNKIPQDVSGDTGGGQVRPEGKVGPTPPSDRTTLYATLRVIIVLGGVGWSIALGWWYLKKSQDSGTTSTQAPVSVLVSSGTTPKKSVVGSAVAVQEEAKPPKSEPEPTSSVVAQSQSLGTTMPEAVPSASSEMGEAVSVREVLGLFPIGEAGRYIDGMLAGVRDGNDAVIINAKRLLQGLALPPRGKRKGARATNKAALEFLQRDDATGAVNLLLGAVKADPADQEIVNNLADALYKARRFQDAHSVAIAALALAPERAVAWANLAAILADEGRPDAAVSAFMLLYRFSQNRQKTTDFLQGLIQGESSVQVRSAAEKALSKISAMPVSVPIPSATANPAVVGMLQDGENCMAMKKYDCAMTNAKAAMRIDPSSSHAQTLLRRAEAEQKRAMDSIVIN